MPGIKPPPIFTAAAGLTFGGGSNAGSGGAKIEHRVGVHAPAQVIWDIVADLPSWGAWNPLYTKAEGDLRIGSVLTLELVLPGERPQTIRPVILDWVPRDQIHWRYSALGGLISSIRYIEIEILGEENCILSNGELFGGFLGARYVNARRRVLRRGFTEMGEALAMRAEAAWRDRARTPTSPA
jgi:hypothetical protein